MSVAASVVSGVRISDVARALGYPPLRNRIRPPWRETRDRNVSISDEKNCWRDFVSNEGGGLLDFVQKARGCSRADAVRWCADLAGVPLDDKTFTPADRRRWAEERRAIEHDLAAARYWRWAAVAMAEDVLLNLKSALFDPTMPTPGPNEIGDWTARLARWQRIDSGELVSEYRDWLERNPTWARALVNAGRNAQRRLQVRLAKFITEKLSASTAA